MPDRRRFALLKQPFALDALGDVTISSPVTGQVIQYNGTVWANTTLSITASQVSDFSEAVDDRVAALLSIGNGLTATYNDPGNTYTLSANIDGTSLAFATGVIQRAALTGDVTASAGSNTTSIAANAVVTAKINDKAVTYAKIQDVTATSRFLGRITAAAGVMEELTGTQATTLLDAFTSTLKGLVPASGGGTTNFLRADGSWAAPSGGGAAAFDPNIRYDSFDDLDGLFGSTWTSAVSGGTSTNLTAVAGRPGIRRNDTGTSSSTNYAISVKANTTAAALPFVAYSDTYPVTVETEFRVPTLPDGTNTFIATVGLINTPTGSNSQASVGIGWDAGASQARFMCRIRSSGGTITTTYYATTAPAANTWYRARVVIRATDVTAYVYLSGAWTLIATMTTNLPTEAGTPFFTCTKSAGTGARQIDVDYVWVYCDMSGGRPA